LLLLLLLLLPVMLLVPLPPPPDREAASFDDGNRVPPVRVIFLSDMIDEYNNCLGYFDVRLRWIRDGSMRWKVAVVALASCFLSLSILHVKRTKDDALAV
jgi:hypothetical protein